MPLVPVRRSGLATPWVTRPSALLALSLASPLLAQTAHQAPPAWLDALEVRAATVQTLPDLPQTDWTAFGTSIEVEGVDLLLELEPFSMRAPDFAVESIGDEGAFLLAELPPLTTYRGAVRRAQDALVIGAIAASVQDGAMHAVLALDDGRGFEIAPARSLSTAASPDQHLVFALSDLLPVPGICGNQNHAAHSGHLPGGGGPAPRGTTRHLTDIAFDADFRFYQQNSSSELNTVIDIERVMNVIEGIYESDLDISYEITRVVVRTSNAADPYTTDNPGALLNQFENEWNTNLDRIPRDVAHLMTGRNLNGNIIGLAKLGVVCFRSTAYALSQSRFSSTLTRRAGLTAHELGHNWGAGHCNGDPDCYIMCPSLGGCSFRLDRFGSAALVDIVDHRDTWGCLSELSPPLTLPFYDDFEFSGGFDPERWPYVRRALLHTPVNTTSGAWVARLNSLDSPPYNEDDMRSNEIDLSTASNVFLSFFARERRCDPGDFLHVDFYDQSRSWTRLYSVAATGALEAAYTYHRVAIPAGGLWNEFRFRFVTEGDETTDRWLLDDAQVSTGFSLEVTPLQVGQTGKFQVYGAEANEQAYLIYSLNGLGPGPCFFSGSLCLDIQSPVLLLGAVTTDALGFGSVDFPVPAGTPSIPIAAQAVILRGAVDHVKSNTAVRTVQP